MLIPFIFVALATAACVGFGLHDGWLRLPRRFRRIHVAGLPGRPMARFNHAGIIELARFASVRRRIGYQEGNEIIRVLAQRLVSQGNFQLGRAGRTSIEFLYEARDAADARTMIERLQAVLEQPVTTAKLTYAPQVVIGSNFVPSGELTDELFDISAFAVEEAARLPERISFANPAQPAQTSSVDLYADFAKSLRERSLELHYMPKLRLADEIAFGAEALSRWNHPRHGSVPPSTFVEMAEETGLIGELTLWSLDQAIADQQRLAEAGFQLDIDVNFSGQLVSDAAFCELARERILASRGKIGIEITETAVIEDPQAAIANLRDLAAAGVHIAIDDFGSGLSSLAYLRELPAHELKIDRSFVRNLTTNNRDPLLVRSAIEIAHALDMEVTAEGVEDGLALGLLKVMRCTNVQGYHVSAPLPLNLLIEYLRVSAAPGRPEIESSRERLLGRAASV